MIAEDRNDYLEATKIEIKEWQILLILFAAAFLLRLIRLFYLDVWFDEVAILFQLQMSFGEIWNFCKNENFPPLYPWLLKLWSVFGASDNWMRLFSALLGAAIPPAAYLVGREMSGRRLGLMVGLACIISLPLYYYSQVIRMYSLFVLMACLSYYGFFRALRTGEWRYWCWVALANLAGFYTFLFMVFLISSQFVVLVSVFRFDIKRYARPVLAHLPAFALMSLWVLVLLARYQAVRSYSAGPVEFRRDLSSFWVFLGTGYKAPYRPLLMTIINLPFLMGLLLGSRHWRARRAVLAGAVIGGVSVLLILALSLEDSIFWNRYMLFLLPLYLALVFFGWTRLSSSLWRTIGVAAIFGSLLFGQVFYWAHYHEVNDAFRHHGLFRRPANDDGRSMSRTAALLRVRIRPDEVLIHYSAGLQKSFSFFNFIYYHQRALPEYVYSLQGIAQYAGQQYLHPGDLIKSLRELPQSPEGIWVITLNPAYIIMKGSQASREAQRIIAEEGDLPSELKEFGFEPQETMRDGAVTALHFRRAAALGPSSVPEMEK